VANHAVVGAGQNRPLRKKIEEILNRWYTLFCRSAMSSAVNLHPIDPLRGPLVITVANDTTWTSQPWSNLTHSGCTVYISSDQAIILRIDHASGTPDLASAPVSSMHSVAAYVPVSFHVKLDGRVSQVRVINSSGMSANVTVDVLLRPPTAEDHASMRLTMEGLDIGYGNPLPVSGTISNAVEVSQWDASSLNATVTQAGTVTVAATALDTRALTSATDTVTVTGTVLVNPGGLNLPATVFQDDPTELQCTVTQAGTVVTQGSPILVKTVIVTESSAVQFLVDRQCTLYGYSFTTTAARAVVHYYDADSTDSVTTSTVPAFSIPVETNQTALTFGNGDHITFASGLAVRINDNYNYTGTTGPGTSSITVYYR